MVFELSKVEKIIGYTFKKPEILRVAFTHASFSNEKKGEKNNERLEYLGDSVLGFVVADYLFRTTNEDEGDMTTLKQSIVSFKPLNLACKKLKLSKYLLVGEKVVVTDKLQENLMESVIGAIYLDGGIDEARKFITENLIKPYINVKDKVVDYKSELNELSSKKRFEVSYELLKKEGLDNNPTHTVAVLIDGKVVAKATANGKKQNAEQLVAKKALSLLSKQKNNKR